MQADTQPQLADITSLLGQTRQLAMLDVNDTPFLSVYLDTRPGMRGCRQFIEDKAARIRPQLPGMERLEFENAFNMVCRGLERGWHPEMQGAAIFARGLAGGRHLTTIPLAIPVRNSLAVYRAPEILPLLAVKDSHPAFTLLLVRQGSVQVLESNAGRVVRHARTPVQWLHPAVQRPPQGALSVSSLQRIHRLLSADTCGPLVVAADADSLAAVVAWLPRRAVSRLLHRLEVPADLGHAEVVDFVQSSVTAALAETRTQLAARLVRAMRLHGPAVIGQVATLEALRGGFAETLVIADGYDASGVSQWEAKIELPRLACAQGVDVVVADSDELRYLGGVGCLLRRRDREHAMPLPAHFGQLDLVA